MTPKEYLQQYQRLDREINLLLDERQHWVDLATKVTPTYSDTSGGGSGGCGKVPNAVEKIVEWEQKIDLKVDELVELREEIEGLIATVKNRDYRTLLQLRYISGYTLEKIAVEMNYSYQWICKLHGRALLSLKELIEVYTPSVI